MTHAVYAPYCHLWPAQLFNIFPHYLIKGMILENKSLIITKYTFRLSLQMYLKHFIVRRTERDMINNVYWSSCNVPVIIERFWWNLKLLDRFSKHTQISNFMKIRSNFMKIRSNFMKIRSNFMKIRSQFHENPSSGSRVVPYGRTDRQTCRS